MSTEFETLNKKIEEYCEENSIMGVLRVTVKDEVRFEKYIGYSDLERRLPFTPASVFTYYSLSKPFCAIGLMLLWDKGLIDLDAHPSAYVPECKGFDGRLKVRHLLHHVSGVPDFSQTEEFRNAYKTGPYEKLREHLSLISEYPMLFEPGTEDRYTNINFVICALMIENVTGRRYAEYMKTEVFTPLGMVSTVVDTPDMQIEGRVVGYTLTDGRLTPVKKDCNWMFGGGDLIGTVDDVYCLNRAIKHRLLLSDAAWDEILTPSPINKMGKGCRITEWHGKHRITHNGGSLGFRTLHIQLPEDDFDIIFLSNSGFGNARKDLAEIVYGTFYGERSDTGEDVEMDKGYI